MIGGSYDASKSLSSNLLKGQPFLVKALLVSIKVATAFSPLIELKRTCKDMVLVIFLRI
jgi:hypothetical protein